MATSTMIQILVLCEQFDVDTKYIPQLLCDAKIMRTAAIMHVRFHSTSHKVLFLVVSYWHSLPVTCCIY